MKQMIVITTIVSCCPLLNHVPNSLLSLQNWRLLLFSIIVLLGLSLFVINNELGPHVSTDGNTNTILQLTERMISRKSAREFIPFTYVDVFRARSAIC